MKRKQALNLLLAALASLVFFALCIQPADASLNNHLKPLNEYSPSSVTAIYLGYSEACLENLQGRNLDHKAALVQIDLDERSETWLSNNKRDKLKLEALKQVGQLRMLEDYLGGELIQNEAYTSNLEDIDVYCDNLYSTLLDRALRN